jgi:hypothetical protein
VDLKRRQLAASPRSAARPRIVRTQPNWSPGSPRHPFGWRRMVVLTLLTGLTAVVVAYMQLTVPIRSQSLSRGDALHYWPVAAISGVVVLIGSAAVMWLSLRASMRRK